MLRIPPLENPNEVPHLFRGSYSARKFEAYQNSRRPERAVPLSDNRSPRTFRVPSGTVIDNDDLFLDADVLYTPYNFCNSSNLVVNGYDRG